MNPIAYAKKFTSVAVTGLFDQLRRNRELALNAAEHPKCLLSDSKVEGNEFRCAKCGDTAEWKEGAGAGACKMEVHNIYYRDAKAYCQDDGLPWNEHRCDYPGCFNKRPRHTSRCETHQS